MLLCVPAWRTLCCSYTSISDWGLIAWSLQATGKLDLKEPYYRQLTQWPTDPQAWGAQTAADPTAAEVPVDEGIFADAQPEDAGTPQVAAGAAAH